MEPKTIFSMVCICLMGCARYDIAYVDSNFSKDEQKQIKAAADEWCNRTDQSACIDLVFGCSVSPGNDNSRFEIIRMEPTDSRFQEANMIPMAVGVHYYGKRSGLKISGTSETIVLLASEATLNGTCLQSNALHEFGHHFDLRDMDPEDHAVMSQNTSCDLISLTKKDLDTYWYN